MKKGNTLFILIIILALTITALVYFGAKKLDITPFKQAATLPTNQVQQKEINNNDQLKSYTSKDLKISFKYPKDWYIDDRYQMILITNYNTNLNKDDKPTNDQIELLISNFNGCHDTLEENLIDPACGEGGPTVAKNKILSKETSQTKESTFYKYVVQTPNSTLTYYLLKNNDKVLQIEKHPDPSQFDKEFEEIINSIEFL
jgi:hypothetical protein